MRGRTYGDVFQPPSEQEMRKRVSIVNVLKERRGCAEIARNWWKKLETVGDPKHQQIRREACEAIAAAIEARPNAFQTVGDIMGDTE